MDPSFNKIFFIFHLKFTHTNICNSCFYFVYSKYVQEVDASSANSYETIENKFIWSNVYCLSLLLKGHIQYSENLQYALL